MMLENYFQDSHFANSKFDRAVMFNCQTACFIYTPFLFSSISSIIVFNRTDPTGLTI